MSEVQRRAWISKAKRRAGCQKLREGLVVRSLEKGWMSKA